MTTEVTFVAVNAESLARRYLSRPITCFPLLYQPHAMEAMKLNEGGEGIERLYRGLHNDYTVSRESSSGHRWTVEYIQICKIFGSVELKQTSFIIGCFTFRKQYWSYGDTVVTSCCGKSDRYGVITDALFLTQ